MTEWQPIANGPTHRRDVLIMSAEGGIGIGWFSQMKSGPSLNLEYLSRSDPLPSLDEEIAAKTITHWQEPPAQPSVKGTPDDE